MTPEVAQNLARAKDSLSAARSLLSLGHHSISASRAYYAMFYAARAALISRGHRIKTHSAIHSTFSQEFTNAGLLRRDLHGWLLDAAQDRIIGDYDVSVEVSEVAARTHIDRAATFVELVVVFLEGA